MRVMLDTNVLFSAILFPHGKAASALQKCLLDHCPVIPSYFIDELKRVVGKKFPDRLPAIDLFLEQLTFELVYTPENIKEGVIIIRDPKDYPILYMAITENVDVLLTGDADFKDTDITHPQILTPSEFVEKY